MLGGSLLRLHLEGTTSDCELDPSAGAPFLAGLTGLTSLQLDSCAPCPGPCLSRLTGLRSLVISREDGAEDGNGGMPFCQYTGLRCLTRLELLGFCPNDCFPEALGQLRALRCLSFEGSDLQDHLGSLE